MDSYLFHQQATAGDPPLPHVTAAALATASDEQLFELAEEVTGWLAGMFLPTTATEMVLAQVDRTIRFNHRARPGSKTIVGLSGPNGAGKSTVLHEWAIRYYRDQIRPFPAGPVLHRWEPSPGVSADVAPVVWINLQANSRIGAVDSQLLLFLRAPSSGSLREMTIRAVRAMGRHRVQVLVIDDVHLLQTRSAQGRHVLDHLKHLNTELGEQGASLVLAGANIEDSELVNDPQIATRLRLLQLRPNPRRTAADKDDWKQLLDAASAHLSTVLPAAKPGDLNQHAEYLHHLTGGYTGELINVLKEAAINAILCREGAITRSCIDAAPLSHRATSQRPSLQRP